jgi:hypothetical protein
VETKPALDALQEAVTVAEQSRARNLMDHLHGTDLAPANAPPGLMEPFHALRRKLELAWLRLERGEQGPLGGEGFLGEGLRATATSLRMPTNLAATATVTAATDEAVATGNAAKLRAGVEQLEREVANQLTELLRHDPDYNPEGVAPVLSFEQIQELIPTDVPTAFVQLTLTRDETIALVTTRTGAFSIRSKELTDPRAWKLAEAWFDSYYNKSSRRFVEWERPIGERTSRRILTSILNVNVWWFSSSTPAAASKVTIWCPLERWIPFSVIPGRYSV